MHVYGHTSDLCPGWGVLIKIAQPFAFFYNGTGSKNNNVKLSCSQSSYTVELIMDCDG